MAEHVACARKQEKKDIKLYSEDLKDHFGPLSVDRKADLTLKQLLQKFDMRARIRIKWSSRVCNDYKGV